MPRAAQIATVGFAGMIVFQAALAAGARLGDAAWGGADAQLTAGQRVGSAVGPSTAKAWRHSAWRAFLPRSTSQFVGAVRIRADRL